MRILSLSILVLLVAGCSVALNDDQLTAYFDGQKGRWLAEKYTKGCRPVILRDNLVEFVPQEIPKSGWAVVWTVDTSRLSEINPRSSQKLAGMIVSWRIIGDRSKVRVRITYSVGGIAHEEEINTPVRERHHARMRLSI
jgi:hypothetical protein